MSRSAAAPQPTASPPRPVSYLEQSALSFPSLLSLLPLLVAYELGTRYYAADISDIKAFSLLQDFFHWFGATGRYLPAMAVVGILLSCHITRKDPWRVHSSTLAGMTLESIVWGRAAAAFGPSGHAIRAPLGRRGQPARPGHPVAGRRGSTRNWFSG